MTLKNAFLVAAALVAGAASFEPAGGIPQAQAQQRNSPLAAGEHEFRVDGVRLWYRVAGRPRGVPVVFLHGGPGQGSHPFEVYGGRQLERNHRIVYLDQRGAGRSDRPSDLSKYSMEIMVDDVERLRRHLGVARIALLGHSFGTRLALEYAAKYPQHTAAVVLAAAATDLVHSLDEQCQRLAVEDPAAYARAIEGRQADARPRCDTRRAYSGDAATAFATRNVFPEPTVRQIVDRLSTVHGANTGEASRALFQQGYMQYRFTRADQVRAPVLIIAGGHDFQASLKPQQDLAARLPRGRLLVYPTNGHFMFVEDPDRFARDVSAFLRRVR